MENLLIKDHGERVEGGNSFRSGGSVKKAGRHVTKFFNVHVAREHLYDLSRVSREAKSKRVPSSWPFLVTTEKAPSVLPITRRRCETDGRLSRERSRGRRPVDRPVSSSKLFTKRKDKLLTQSLSMFALLLYFSSFSFFFPNDFRPEEFC